MEYIMKRTVLFVLAILFASNFILAIERNDPSSTPPKMIIPEDKSSATPKPLAASDKNIIIFNNLDYDIQDNNGTTISNYFELAYLDPLEIYPTADPYLNHTVVVPFSDLTFTQYKITDFDVAIFPMGDYALNTATNGGIKVFDKIKEMLNADKNVMIIGRRMLTGAFHNPPTQDPAVSDFLSSDLGLKSDSSGPYGFLMGNTFIPFRVIGVSSGIFFNAYTMYCNIGYARQGADPELPIRSESNVDIAILKNNAKAIGIDYIDQVGDVGDNKPTLSPHNWVGLRADAVQGNGRLVMWTIAPNVAALNEMHYFGNKIQDGINWLLENVPKLKPYLKFETNTLTFDLTPLDYPRLKTVKVQNFSKDKLIIYQTVTIGMEGDVFTVTKGINNDTLDPMETRSIEVQFKPNEEREFDDFLNVASNASNGSPLSIQLQGRGGKNVSVEPEISIQSDPYDFGTVNVSSSPTLDLKFMNAGLQDLIVDSLYFESNTDNAFNFPNIMQTPIVVKEGKEYIFSVRFAPTEWGKNYSAKIKVVSNAKKNPIAYINLMGKTPGASEGPIISALDDTTDLGIVKIETTTKGYIGITNPGSQSLKIQNIFIKDNPEDAFVIDTTFEFPFFILPNESLQIPIQFTPITHDAEYIATIGIFSNAFNAAAYYVYVRGVGDSGTSVRETISNSSHTLQLQAIPNPTNYSSTITINSQKFYSSTTVELYNLLGKKILDIYQGNIVVGTNQFNLDASNLPTGQYFIILNAETEKLSLPLIIAK